MNSQPETKRETRAQRRIRLAAEARGLTVDEATWEPIGQMLEMSGRDGGWTVWLADGPVVTGYSVDDVIEMFDLYPVEDMERDSVPETNLTTRKDHA